MLYENTLKLNYSVTDCDKYSFVPVTIGSIDNRKLKLEADGTVVFFQSNLFSY